MNLMDWMVYRRSLAEQQTVATKEFDQRRAARLKAAIPEYLFLIGDRKITALDLYDMITVTNQRLDALESGKKLEVIEDLLAGQTLDQVDKLESEEGVRILNVDPAPRPRFDVRVRRTREV